jgi:diguanylate cyclase (GGDEF)-like protein
MWLWSASGIAAPLVLGQQGTVPVWDAVTVWVDAQKSADIHQILAKPEAFAPPEGARYNLGREDGSVWLRIPLRVDGALAQQRVLEIDYPLLHLIDLYLVRDGRVVEHQRMGNLLRFSERPLPMRHHAAPLTLEPGDSELLLQVRSQSAMVLPISLSTPLAMAERESRLQLVQGLIIGLSLCMLIYSLSHFVSLRDPLFFDYALLLACNILYMLSYFGIGRKYLWPEVSAAATQVAPLAVMAAVWACTRFMRSTLDADVTSPRTGLLLRATGIAALASIVLSLLGIISYVGSQVVATILGPTVTLLVLPLTVQRAFRGERVAVLILIGWTFYTFGALTTAGLVRGLVEPTFWTQHIYPLSTLIEMSAWMAVLGLRVQSIHRTADRARMESETQRRLAQTDALTGLANRRGLQQRLDELLAGAAPNAMLAIYLMDLDGFKPVNDRFGHDVGDALLVEVGKRLQGQLRASDVAARLGGDEFVVLCSGIPDTAAAAEIGQNLLDAFTAPFEVAGQVCNVGLTVGYALAPMDGHSAEALIKRADAAMYAGKKTGRGRLLRDGESLALA